MKRLFLLLICAIILTPAYAERISRRDAQQIAENFFRQNGKTSSLELDNLSPETKSSQEEPAYYVFNNVNGTGGFVIVSGDDSTRQILAYSLTGYFDTTDMPENVAFWMKSMEESIRQGMTITRSVSSSEQSPYEKVLQTATWSQGAPYNDMCPIVKGTKAVTGCSATATAIVMRYHKWPDAGVGVLPDYKNSYDNNNIQPGHALGHPYDWDHMPLNLTTGSSELEIKEVSQLMFDIGIMLQMDYSPAGSGSSVGTGYLIRHMKYDPNMLSISRGEPENRSYTDSEWFDIIKQEIDADRPILYAGYEGSGGHEFVVDGYRSDGYIHINWGWGPSNLGFYALDNMNYNHGQSIIVGMKPNREGIPDEFIIAYDGIKRSPYDDEDGLFNILSNWHEKYYRDECDCYVGFWKVRKDGELKECIGWMRLSDPIFQYFQFRLTENDEFGDYVMPFYRLFDEDQWRPMVFTGQYKAIEKLPLFDKRELEKRTSISYNKQTRKIEVLSDEYAVFELMDDSGRKTPDILKTEKGRATVSIDALPSSYCTIRVSLSGHSIDLHIKGGEGSMNQEGTENIRKGETIEW